ncbi:long-chain fatty acid-CoA ligase [Cadophora gregata]|uniref:long-chain fatty acid-CoA ligase n=1 Tax=Cadophora gregata TaxID=51156 RepID=UPI0026DDA5DC|nr:long-chain fatty acid-CoA ligase [Cadophora gregata]KAK0124186.1 long-chain fatty acid-CoA ligase [Cadophora gregata]
MPPNSTTFEPRMSRKPPFTIPVVDAPSIPGETAPRRNARAFENLVCKPDESISTLYDIVEQSVLRHGDQKALGSRRIVQMHHEIKKVRKLVDGDIRETEKKWSYFELGGYEYMSFTEYHKQVLELGSGLRKLGLASPDRVHMFASTSAHWLATAHGAISQSMPIVTAYDTLGENGLRHSLKATKARAIFLEPHLITILIKVLSDAKDIQFIVYNTDSEHSIRQEDLQVLKASFEKITILSFEELRHLGAQSHTDPVLPAADDLAYIMYTSGSTGVPKGVELTHKNIVAAVAGINTTLGDYLHPGDGLLAYLPLAHIFEVLLEHVALYRGITLGYGSPRTLSEANCRNCLGDIREFKPTLLVGVPAVWETVKKGIIANVDHGGTVMKSAFWSAFYAKRALTSSGIPGGKLLDALVFNKVKDATGGRLRVCLTSAAPISKETQEFISIAIAPLISAYGMTETAGMGAICDPRTWTVDACGEVESSVEVKLVDYPDAGYLATNLPNPQGEVWIRGHSVTAGYYQNPDETAAAFSDGWFMTGDIGEWNQNGHLRIIDRKKNLVKTLNGEYIALEKLESLYRSAPIVANLCVYASTSETHPIILIQPVEPALIKLAASLGIKRKVIGDLIYEERIQQVALHQMQAIGKRSGLSGIEIVVGVVLTDEEWTPQNNLVTPTLKLNRKALFDRYQKEIGAAYTKSKK